MQTNGPSQRHGGQLTGVLVRYLSHPQVCIDPSKDSRCWSLSEPGHARVAALRQSNVLRGTKRIVTSFENRALQTAKPLADALGCWLEYRGQTYEDARAATGYLPEPWSEKCAVAYFANPDQSIQGWEPARLAQQRIIAEVGEVLRTHRGGDILIVGQGALGTLLYCALANKPISRTFDQPAGGGNVFAFRTNDCLPLSGWQPMESLSLWPCTASLSEADAWTAS